MVQLPTGAHSLQPVFALLIFFIEPRIRLVNNFDRSILVTQVNCGVSRSHTIVVGCGVILGQ